MKTITKTLSTSTSTFCPMLLGLCICIIRMSGQHFKIRLGFESLTFQSSSVLSNHRVPSTKIPLEWTNFSLCADWALDSVLWLSAISEFWPSLEIVWHYFPHKLWAEDYKLIEIIAFLDKILLLDMTYYVHVNSILK